MNELSDFNFDRICTLHENLHNLLIEESNADVVYVLCFEIAAMIVCAKDFENNLKKIIESLIQHHINRIKKEKL
jgi:hypothetical protein